MSGYFKLPLMYSLIALLCIAGYFITGSILGDKLLEKNLSFTSVTASEVYLAWGTTNGVLPDEHLWPQGSKLKDRIIFSPVERAGNRFYTTLKLPLGSDIYYWWVQIKDRAGNETDIWDSGDKEFYTLVFSGNAFERPGYFIFLAGFLPLLLFFLKNKNKTGVIVNDKFKIKDYIPQFDSIRAIAVLLVIIHHWLPQKSIFNFLPNGKIGVNIFFVLSGFLITGILLKAKMQIETSRLKKGMALKNFYIRRTLRIFPIYYLLLFILWLLKDPAIHENGVYYYTYTSNFLFYMQTAFPARLAHLWSLGVEEQFYVIWPWLIILVNRRFIPYLICLFLLIGISANYIFTDHGWWVEILTPACFDAFAIGAILSYYTLYRQDIITAIQPKYKWIFLAILVIFVLGAFSFFILPPRTGHALLAAAIIYYCLFKNNNSIVNFIFNNKWLMWMGKISYGIYLYHLFIPELWQWINTKFNSNNIDFFYNQAMPVSLKPMWLFIQEFSFLLLISMLSWKLIEKPVNDLKKRFQNKPPLSGNKPETETVPA